LDADEKAGLIAAEPRASRYLRRFVGSDEFLSDIERWCLWLVDADPGDLRHIPEVMRRVDAVRDQRLRSRRPTTQQLARTPTLFGEIRQPATDYLLIPGVSSENRRYIPLGFMSADVIASNLVYCFEGADEWHFGVLSSAMHMSWVATVCGRLKSDYRYSNKLVYNNFPWPSDDIEERRRNAVRNAARAVLEARRPFLRPEGTNSLADLYDPLAMPPVLVRAHEELDRAVDRCYRGEAFRSNRERVEHLFAGFERLTAPLIPERARRRRRA
jgi:hypothetical protein